MFKAPVVVIPGGLKEYPIGVALGMMAAKDGCDGEPYDQMQIASEYIEDLENRLKAIGRICTSGEAPKLEEKSQEPQCSLKQWCRSIKTPELCREGGCGNFTEELKASLMSNKNKPVLDIGHAQGFRICVYCSVTLYQDMATKTWKCDKCGQRYSVI